MKPEADFSQLYDVKPFEPVSQGGTGWVWFVGVGLVLIILLIGWRVWRARRRGSAHISLDEHWEQLRARLRDQWSELSFDEKERLFRDVIYTTSHLFLGQPVDDKTPEELKEIWRHIPTQLSQDQSETLVWPQWDQLLDDWEQLHYASNQNNDMMMHAFRQRLLEVLQRFVDVIPNQQASTPKNNKHGNISVS